MQRATNKFLFLFVALLSVNLYHPFQCSPVPNCDPVPCDPCYEETKQELADEIDDVNDYMQMVADQLTNDDVIVVRAIRTRFNFPDIESISKPDNSALGAGDYSCDQSEETESLETISSAKTDLEPLPKHENISPIDTKLKEMRQTSFEVEESAVKMENLTSIYTPE